MVSVSPEDHVLRCLINASFLSHVDCENIEIPLVNELELLLERFFMVSKELNLISQRLTGS